MRIFVSGGAGHIGRYLVNDLTRRGHELFVGDVKSRPNDFHEQVHFWQGDLNFMSLAEFQEISPDIVIHLAATFERLEETSCFYESGYWNNTQLSHHFLSLVKDTPSVSKYLFASSYLVYKNSKRLTANQSSIHDLLSEKSVIEPRNLIAAAKLFHEMEMEHVRRTSKRDISLTAMRIFRGYDLGDDCVISRWIRAAISNNPIEVFDKENSFDYISAEECGYIISQLCEVENLPKSINIATGQSSLIQDILEEIQRQVTNEKLEVTFGKSQYLENSSSNNSLLDSILPSRRRFSDVLINVSDMVKHERSNKI